MARAGTYFTLDVDEAAFVARALRTRITVLRKEAKNRHNTDLIARHIHGELAGCEEVQDRLEERFRKTRAQLEALMRGQADAR